MINRVVLVGRITRDPELRNTSGNMSVCSFTIAVDNRGKDAEGKKTASFIPCVAFREAAELMAKSIRKGALLGVEGRLSQRSFVRQDGSKGSVLEVLCDSVQFLEPKQRVENSEPDIPPFDDMPAASESKNLDTLDIPEDDCPF